MGILLCSASVHLSGRDDTLVKVAPLLEMVDDWARVLSAEIEATFGRRQFCGEIGECLGQIVTASKTRPKDKGQGELTRIMQLTTENTENHIDNKIETNSFL